MSTLPRKRQKKYFIANKFLRVGAPLVAMVLVGFGGITHLLEGRREVQRAKEDEDWIILQTSKNISRDGPLEGGSLPRPKLNLEDELKKLMEKVNINDFEYKPVPKSKSRDD